MEKHKADKMNYMVYDCGPFPLDKVIIIECRKEDLFIAVYSSPEHIVYYVLKESLISCYDNEKEIEDIIVESYESLKDTRVSSFFEDFLVLDARLDKKIQEIKEHILDSKYYEYRIAPYFDSDEIVIYAEVFNSLQPEHKEYLQIQKRKNSAKYTASHESYFMNYYLGDSYSHFFGEPPKEEYFINIADLSELDYKYYYFAESFRSLWRLISKFESEEGMNENDEHYDPIVTAIIGLNENKIRIIEMVLDKNRKIRFYLSVQQTKENTFIYRVSRSSILAGIKSQDQEPVIECEQESEDMDSISEEFWPYFKRLKKSYADMIKSGKSYKWRYGCK